MAQQEMYSAPALSEVVTLTADISSSDTTIPVDFPERLPEAPNLITLGIDESTVEVVLYNDKDATSLVDCIRGFAGTPAASWGSGTKAARTFTSYDHNAFKNNIQETLLDYSRLPGFAITSGAADDYEVTLDPAPGTIGDGFGLCLAIHETNTGASTVTINGGSPIGLKKPDGTNFAAGELVEGQIYNFRFLGTDFLAVNVGKEDDSGGGGDVPDINGQQEVPMEYGENLDAGDPVFITTRHELAYSYSDATMGTGIAISPDGNYLAFCTAVAPVIRVFKRQPDDTFTALSITSSLTGTIVIPYWSPDGTHLIVTTNVSPWCQVYKRDGDTFTLINPSAIVSGLSARPAIAYSPDGSLLIMAFVSQATRVLSRSGDTYTAVSNSIATGYYNIEFSPDGSTLIGTKTSSPYVDFYSVSGTTFTSKTSPLSIMPTSTVYTTAFSPDGNYFALISTSAPVLWVFKINSPTSWVRCRYLYMPTSNLTSYYKLLTFSEDSRMVYFCLGFSSVATIDRLMSFVIDDDMVMPFTFSDYGPDMLNQLVYGVSQQGGLLAVAGQNTSSAYAFKVFRKNRVAVKCTYKNRINAEGAGYTLSTGTKGQVKTIMQITN